MASARNFSYRLDRWEKDQFRRGLADLVVQVIEGGDGDILCGILDEDVCLGDRRCNDEGDTGKDSGGKGKETRGDHCQ